MALLRLCHMTQKKTDQGEIVRSSLELVVEDVALHEGARRRAIERFDPSSGLGEHPCGLIEHRHARTLARILREPVAGSAREVEQSPSGRPADDFAKRHCLRDEEIRTCNRGGAGSMRIRLVVFGCALVVVLHHAAAQGVVE